MLLAKGADINVRDSTTGATSLHWASLHNHKEVVQALLGKGADVNVKANNGDTALSLASSKGNKEIRKLLLKAGAK